MTKAIILTMGLLAVLGVASLAIAESDKPTAPEASEKSHSADNAEPGDNASATQLIDGEVTKIDSSAGKITIKHGPILKLGMDEGMTMVFRAQDAAMLDTIEAGDKIRFDADRVNGQFTVIEIEKAE